MYEPVGSIPSQKTCLNAPPADPVIRERIDGYVKRIYNCLNFAREIDGKIFNPSPTNYCPTGEKGPVTIEGLLYELDQISLDLEVTLARVNSKL
jgi:hypothetical protein